MLFFLQDGHECGQHPNCQYVNFSSLFYNKAYWLEDPSFLQVLLNIQVFLWYPISQWQNIVENKAIA